LFFKTQRMSSPRNWPHYTVRFEITNTCRRQFVFPLGRSCSLFLNSARKYILPERFFVIPALGMVNTLCWSWSLEFYFAYDAPGFKLNRTGDGVELHLCSGNLWIQSRSNYRLCVGEGCLFVCEWVSAVLFSILTGNVNGKVNNTH